MADLVRMAAPPLLAAAAAVWIDLASRRRGLLPPGFTQGSPDSLPALASVGRRLLAALLVAATLWVGVFAPLSALGSPSEMDLDAIRAPQLFLLHGILVAAALAWWALGYVGSRSGPREQLGLRASRPWRELGIGVVAGAVAWLAVIVTMLSSAFVLWRLGAGELLPEEAPALVGWLAGLPLILRVAVSLSAGFAEEIFFRGYLQPRAGIAFSSLLFVLAHLSYEQPFMLLGITLLSVVFALLVKWRQSIWAAVAAHATFDLIQLTIVIPWALERLQEGA
jgi:membrane protease YdiL (CAAX protease family)